MPKMEARRFLTCADGKMFQDVAAIAKIMVSSLNKLGCIDFGDLIGSGGGAEKASKVRVRRASAKFRERAKVLTSTKTSLKLNERYTESVFKVSWDMQVKLGL